MNLTYRGVSYDATSSETFNSASTRPIVDLKYRGVAYRLGETAKLGRLSAIFKYRGTEYRMQTSDRGLSASVTSSVSGSPLQVEDKARVLTMNHDRSLRKRLQSMLIRSEMEVGCA